MSNKPKSASVNISIEELLAKTPLTDRPDLYANHIQVTVSSSEMFIDFYYISPLSGKPPRMVHVQRITAPVSMGKGLASALANVIALYETDNKITLPSSRENQPEDLITIWP